jgi:CoA:oxalate CoA-transferase
MNLPLKGITVLEFSQYLSGPCAGLRLADMGARIIKIERPEKGDAGRRLAISNLWVDESSLLFHTINRNKESFIADLKNAEDLKFIKQLIEIADVITHNFRPGVMEALGLDYNSVQKMNPRVIYAEISGYGKKGPWKQKPGQDLLAQVISGLAYSSGNKHDDPTPFGLAMSDYLCGNQAVQGIIGALIRRQKTGKGALLELSLLETLLDFQFEFLTTYFETKQQHQRSEINNGHSLLSAPYGLYQTLDGYIAVAMMPLKKLNAIIQYEPLRKYEENESFKKRDEIKSTLAQFFAAFTTDVLLQSSTYQSLNMEQVFLAGEKEIKTTRCPIRFNRQYFLSDKAAPRLGEHTNAIKRSLSKESQ